MAEQYKNLAASTTSGLANTTDPVTFSVASGEGALFPATTNGSFRLLVENEILLVTARTTDSFTVSRAQEGTTAASHAAGSTVTHVLTAGAMDQIRKDIQRFGTFANLPATGTARQGDRYKCTDSEYDYIFDGSIWQAYAHGLQVTRPDLSTFTRVGGTPLVEDNTLGPAYVQVQSGVGYIWTYYYKALPAAPYKITMGFKGWWDKNNGDQSYMSIIQRENSSGKFWGFGLGDNQDANSVILFNDTTTYGGSNPWNSQSTMWAYGNPKYCRIEDDSTNWKYSISLDGKHFQQVFSQTRNTSITPDKYGFGISGHATASLALAMEVFDFTTA